MLSVLIPTYNHDVTPLIESLSNQLTKVPFPFEILVADDASTDKGIIRKNERITDFPNCMLFLMEENKGRSFTRSFLAQKAKYPRLLFMDADVLPERNDFIANFDLENNNAEVVFGGITYAEEKPPESHMLRWKYGKQREARSLKVRKKSPYLSLTSGCLFIEKELFLEISKNLPQGYGEDILYGKLLKDHKAMILHIENPVRHAGLDRSEDFLLKTKSGLETLVALERENKIPEDYRPIQKMYLRLKHNHLTAIFLSVMQIGNFLIEKNLISGNPSLFLFDLYRLRYYALLKSKK